MEDAWRRHKLGSLDQVMRRTRTITRTTLYRLRCGTAQPTVDTVIDWAEAIGEPVNDWLIRAGHHPISLRSVVTDEVIDGVVAEIMNRMPAGLRRHQDEAGLREIITGAIERKTVE